MNFKGHMTGGLITGSALASIASFCCHEPMTHSLFILATTVFFSLFPDTDIASIPQRWFYRGITLILVGLAWQQYYQAATFLAIAALLPLLSKHRGWTHTYWAALGIPIFMALGYHCLTLKQIMQFKAFPYQTLHQVLYQYLWFLVPASMGWITHLILDTIYPDALPLSKKR